VLFIDEGAPNCFSCFRWAKHDHTGPPPPPPTPQLTSSTQRGQPARRGKRSSMRSWITSL
jgi:hypothetical protein